MTSKTYITRWNLHEILPGGTERLDDSLSQIESSLRKVESYRQRLTADMPIADFLELLYNFEELQEQTHRVVGYAYLLFAENTQNQTALSLQNRIDRLLTGVENRSMFFSLWYKSLPDEVANKYIESAGDLHYYLESLRRYKPYTLSEAEEKVISLKDINGSQALVKIYEIITNGFSFNLQVDGEIKKLTRDGLGQYYHHPSADVREGAYKELYRVYGENKTTLTQIYSFLVQDWQAEGVELRGFSNPIAIRNFSNNIPDEVIDRLLHACRQNTEVFQRYFRLKRRILGVDKLKRYDIYAPLTQSEKHIEIRQAISLILDSFELFSPKLSSAAMRILDDAHLDAEVRTGKRSGAFSYSISPKLDPYILINYYGQIRNVTTLAHELGHAVHSILASNHSILNFRPPQPLAETASIFAEMLVTDRLLQEETDPAVQRDLLVAFLDDAYATVQRQAYISIFERDAHAMIINGCTGDELAEHYYKNLYEQFSDAIELSDEFAWEWLTIPHIYTAPFYPYAYSFGQLLVWALYQQYRQDKDSFVPRYLKLLAYGGSAEPQAILAEAGMDITSVEFWQGGFTVLQQYLDRLEHIIGGTQ
jgi:oligoendopeptidase F